MVSISMEQGNKPIIDGVPGATVAPDGPMNALEGGLWNRIPGWFQRSLGFAAVISAPIALLLGVRDLFNISGPGWAVAIAVSNATIMLAAVVSVFEMQHRQDNALRTQERRFRRDAAVSAALPELHLAFHELRNAAVLIDDGNNALTYHDTMIRSLGTCPTCSEWSPARPADSASRILPLHRTGRQNSTKTTSASSRSPPLSVRLV